MSYWVFAQRGGARGDALSAAENKFKYILLDNKNTVTIVRFNIWITVSQDPLHQMCLRLFAVTIKFIKKSAGFWKQSVVRRGSARVNLEIKFGFKISDLKTFTRGCIWRKKRPIVFNNETTIYIDRPDFYLYT